MADRTIPRESPVRTGSSIPAHAEIAVHYEPVARQRVESGGLIGQDHPSASFAVAGYWNLRLGRPVGRTPTGLLVFQPVGMDSLRLTIEHPVREPASPYLGDVRVGVYRTRGLGSWYQTATIVDVTELEQVVSQVRSSDLRPSTSAPRRIEADTVGASAGWPYVVPYGERVSSLDGGENGDASQVAHHESLHADALGIEPRRF